MIFGIRGGIVALAVAASALILAFDLSLPLGVAGGVPYVALVLLGAWFPSARHIVVLAGLGSALTVAGYFLSPEGGVPWVVLANRALALFAIWITAVLLIYLKRGKDRLRQSEEAMRRYVGELESARESYEKQAVDMVGLAEALHTEKELVHHQSRELKEAHDDLRRFFDIVDKHVITSSTDSKGVITSVSEAFCRISKYDRDELIGRTHGILRRPDMPNALYEDLWRTILAGESWSGQILNRAKDGSDYWVDINIEPDLGPDGSIVGYTCIRHDITDKKRVEALSVTDRLTGLFNRLKLEEAFDSELERAKRYGHPLSVVLFDVDHFKQVNDSFGHQVGDEVLVSVAQLTKDNVRAIDVAGRWGGEEFLLLCPETELSGAMAMAEKLRSAIETFDFPAVGRITASFGVAEAKPDESEASLTHRADEALYQAKGSGRNRVVAAD